MTKFEDIKAGNWIVWRDMSNAAYTARVESVGRDVLRLDFGRAPIYRAEFERMGVQRRA